MSQATSTSIVCVNSTYRTPSAHSALHKWASRVINGELNKLSSTKLEMMLRDITTIIKRRKEEELNIQQAGES
ncbi:hypothetical protein [Hymenobacter glaciei]|uniref:hypothetical protein n=1 Tax=Hymenobacter glaciei TaxID=877209 RepID=UPI0031F19183